MDKKSYPKSKSDAHTFFESSKEKLPDTSQFKEILKEKLLSHYIFYNNSRMENISKSRIRQILTKPQFLLGLALVIALPVTALFLLTANNGLIVNPNRKLMAELVYLEGDVLVKSDLGDWEAANKDVTLKEGDKIMIDGTGKAIINLDDGSSVRLNSDTVLALTSMDAQDIKITNEEGEVYARVVKAERSFKILAGEVAYKSLGTAYKTVNKKEEKSVEVYHSQVSILGLNEENEILVEQGNKYYVVNINAPEEENKVIPVNIEEVKSDDFVIWNKEQDETVNEFKDQMGVLFDLEPPVLTVSSPADGFKTTSDKVTVAGATETDVVVSINGTTVANTDGNFSMEIGLNLGSNGIQVISTDGSGNKTVKSFSVVREEAPAPEPVYVPPAPTEAPQPTPAPVFIELSGTTVDGGLSLNWNVSNVDVSKGFKVVKSTSANPVYPGNDYLYLSDPSARNTTWNIKDGKTYHIRVCQYLGGACGVYSNDITLTAPNPPAPVDPITSITLTNIGTTVNWSVTGTFTNGFKLVWSDTNLNPTYGGADIDGAQYYDKAVRTGIMSGNSGTPYYVRVCGNVSSWCDVQSNVITITP